MRLNFARPVQPRRAFLWSEGAEALVSNDNVVRLPCLTTHDIPVERVLSSAQEAGLSSVLVLGYDDDGQLYAASSTSDIGLTLLSMEQLKLMLVQDSDGENRRPRRGA